MSSSAAKNKADLKVVLLGAASVGKTSFLHRYIEGKFQDSASTIGVAFSLKQWGPYNVALWDTAGQERYTGLSSVYCRKAGAAILAFDLTDDESFQILRARFLPLIQEAEPNCLVVVVGMKKDLVTDSNRLINTISEAVSLARGVNSRHLESIPYYETSSKLGHNVDSVFNLIFETCLPALPRDPDVVDISAMTIDEKNVKSGCSC